MAQPLRRRGGAGEAPQVVVAATGGGTSEKPCGRGGVEGKPVDGRVVEDVVAACMAGGAVEAELVCGRVVLAIEVGRDEPVHHGPVRDPAIAVGLVQVLGVRQLALDISISARRERRRSRRPRRGRR